MAKNFDEYNNPEDADMADLKGRLRHAVVERNSSWEEIIAETRLGRETVFSVMMDNNVRHTWRTLHRIARFLDVRIAPIEGYGRRKLQPNELRPLTAKQARFIKALVKKVRAERVKKRK